MERLTVLHQRNRLLLTICWFLFFLGLGSYFLLDSYLSTILKFVAAAGTTLLIAQILHVRNSWPKFNSYLILIGMSISNISVIEHAPSVVVCMLLYMCLVAASLYDDYRPVVMQGLIGTGYLFWLFFMHREEMFVGDEAVFQFVLMVQFYLYIVAMLLVRASLSRKSQLELERQRLDALASQSKAESVLEQILLATENLQRFNREQRENAAMTGELSTELTVSFTEMASGLSHQTHNVTGISEQVQVVDDSIQSVARSSSQVREISGENAQVTAQGSREIETMTNAMDIVNTGIGQTAALIRELNEQTRQIGEILDSITAIAGQTNLLALNAAIEAARAGEHGRGFAVVADEVRKLAENSSRSAEHVATILSDIQVKSEQVARQIGSGQTAMQQSLAVVDRVRDVFDRFARNTDSVVRHAGDLDALVHHLQSASRHIVEETTSVSAISQQATAAIEQVLGNVEAQGERVAQMVDAFAELDDLTNRLKELADE
ncbi:methyl-accepting chemotaxis protein [Tumebacillus sp. DT12]|uniref:Methyl-accepting chemotaxis protein n=1 Tax=Tumebacillus lacus TaxID=2995335 RepID=A0ABT3X560_9BACL|nr:methyl-accepting chemotaxis protein [Tumebacillus lacus]MCX7572042.1 methyl-accepting chemotaxis protein [Tumebacillus lacus]